jgi:ABC-type nitrate/sulfonate/bicarbonate transport system substrate-binding protein
MPELKVLYRDVDRTPYFFSLRHFAKKRGLDLELIVAKPGEPWADRLRDGIVDFIGENYWGLQRERAKGAPFVCVGSVVNHFTEKLLAGPSIQSVADLKGKRMAIRGAPGTPQFLIPAMWLEDIGLAGQVELVSIPDSEVGRWGHWKAVADGRTQATFITNICCEPPLAAGLHPVPFDAYYFEGLNVTLTTREDLVEQRRQDVQALVNAVFDTTAAFKANDPAVFDIIKRECREPLKDHFQVPNDAWLEWLFKELRDELADQPVPTPRGVVNAHRAISDSDENRRFNPMLMWDLSFAREAAKGR